MKLEHIKLENHKTTDLNAHKIGARDIADLVPSIRVGRDAGEHCD